MPSLIKFLTIKPETVLFYHVILVYHTSVSYYCGRNDIEVPDKHVIDFQPTWHLLTHLWEPWVFSHFSEAEQGFVLHSSMSTQVLEGPGSNPGRQVSGTQWPSLPRTSPRPHFFFSQRNDPLDERNFQFLLCFDTLLFHQQRSNLQWGLHSTMDSVLASHPVSLGLILGISNNYWCCWDLLTALLRTVDNWLIMSIQSI